MARLASYLGPWRKATVAPGDVLSRDVLLECPKTGIPVRARVYTPLTRRPIGSYMLAHGLNPQGPYDPRCDRFARVLAHAGFVVVSPELPEYRELLVHPSVAQSFIRAARAFLRAAQDLPWGRPGVFGISFGSYPTLVAASQPELADRFGGVVLFGGYGAFHRTLRFAIGARGDNDVGPGVDKTCLPAVYLNLLPVLEPDLSDADRQVISDAIRRFVARTWGKVEMKAEAKSRSVALDIAASLSGEPARIFRVACGLVPGGVEACLNGLAQHDEGELDPRRSMASIRATVYLLHAADDDVIPCDEIDALAAAVPSQVPVHRFLTGLVDHGGQSGRKGPLQTARGALQELSVMTGMLRAIVRGGCDLG